jgi:branched-chain amino acid aminotransferase
MAKPRIEPLALIQHLCNGFALWTKLNFERNESTKGSDGTPLLFRPDENAKRLNFSADKSRHKFQKIYL